MIAYALAAAWLQAGALDIGPVHIRVTAIGDFTHLGSPVWDATGRKLMPTEVKAIKGIPRGQKSDFDSESLRNKTDLGRFVVLQIDNATGWMVREDDRDHKIVGSSGAGPPGFTLFMSLPKGTGSFDIPFMALHQQDGKLLLDFTDEGPKQLGDMTLSVKSHDSARVSYTKPKGKVIEKKDPLTQYLVTLDAPASWSERFLDLETPGVVWPKSKEPFDSMGPQMMHGIIDERPLGQGRLQITLTVATPGAKVKNQKLRLVERELLKGVIKSLPARPQ